MKITINWIYILGIDISKDKLDVCLLNRKARGSQSHQVPNNPKGFRQLGQWLDDRQAGKQQTIIVSEHTGRYGERLLRWSTDNTWKHAVVKTTALKKVTKEHHRKTDTFDAQKLAEYGDRFSDRLQVVEAPKPATGQLKRFQAERRKMVDRRAALKSKLTESDLHDADMQRLRQMWNQQIALLREHISELEASIKAIISEDSLLYQRHL